MSFSEKPDDKDDVLSLDFTVYKYALERVRENPELYNQLVEVAKQDALWRSLGMDIAPDAIAKIFSVLNVEQVLSIAFPDRKFPEKHRKPVVMFLVRILKMQLDGLNLG
jgi:hypothetical protein